MRNTVPRNQKGVTYSRPIQGTGMPSQERFRHAQLRACLKAGPGFEIASFWMDSSRSYATVMLSQFIILLFQPPNHESTILLGLPKLQRSPSSNKMMGVTGTEVKAQSPGILMPAVSLPPFRLLRFRSRSTCPTSGRRTFGMGPQTRFIALGDARPTKRHGPPPYSDRAE